MNAGCRQALWGTVIFVGGTILSSCGSGNVSQGPPPPPPPPAALTIVTSSNLPGTLVNSAYSQTLQAKNGIGALTWSIAPIAATALFVDGLTIDPST
jgi:hypothetical protein